jgi:splicing suppressor protein 51
MREKYQPISSNIDWYDFYGLEPRSIQPVASMGGVEGPWTADQVRSLWNLCSDNLTNISTILAALEDLYSDIGNRTTLRIHVLGATDKEAFPRQMYEDMLHFLLSLKSLEVYFIGPDIPTGLDPRDSSEPKSYYQGMKLPCDRCKQKGKSLQLRYWRGLYHSFVQTSM